MAKISDVEIPSLLLTEQGSDPTTPASGFARLYAKATGLFFRDDAGTVTGPFSTGGTLRVEDEGVSTVAAATGINFAGAGVTVTDAGSNEALVTIPGAASTLGALGYAQTTTSQGSITTAVDLTSLTVTVTVGSGRRIKVTGWTRPQSSVSGDVAQLEIREGGTTLTIDRVVITGSAALRTLASQVILTPSTGSHTYKLTMSRDDGTGTITNTAGSTHPSYILVEDIGT